MKFKLGLFLFVLVLFINFFLAIYHNQIDKSSYTDWISAFCNLIMAGATVSAIITARNYLAQFTAQEGYKIAISLVNDDLLKIKEYKSVLDAHKLLYKKIDDNKKILPRRGHLGFLKQDMILLNNQSIALKNYIGEIKLKIKKLHTYGLEITEVKSKYFESVLLSCEDILRETKDLLSKSKKISEQIEVLYTENKACNYNYDNNAQPSGILFELKSFESFIPHPVEQVMDKWQILLENYESFFERDNSITEIFKVKKAL